MSIRANLIVGAVIGAFAGAFALALTTFVLLLLTPHWSDVREWFLYVTVPAGGLLGMVVGIARMLSESDKAVDAGYACLFGGAFVVWHFLVPAVCTAGILAGLIICGLPLCLGVAMIWYGFTLCVEGGDRLTDRRLITAAIGGGVLGGFVLALIMMLLATWLFPNIGERVHVFSYMGMSSGWLLGAGLGLSWLLKTERRRIAAGCASLIIGAGVKWRLAAVILWCWPRLSDGQHNMFIVLVGIPIIAAGVVAAYGCTLLEAPKSAD
jgi:hypothetical protein